MQIMGNNYVIGLQINNEQALLNPMMIHSYITAFHINRIYYFGLPQNRLISVYSPQIHNAVRIH